VALPASARVAALSAFAAEAGVALEHGGPGEALGYRVRARLAIRGRAGAPELGIFEEGTHRVVDIPRCVVHDPLVNDTASLVKQALRDLHVAPYADDTHGGLLRYAQIVVERESQRVQVVLVVNAQKHALAPFTPLCERVASLLGARLHGLFLSPNPARGNAILGPSCELVTGSGAVREVIAGAEVFFPPDAFGQANLGVYERIVRRISGFVPDAARVLELYAGTGAIGLSLAPRAAHVAFNEIGGGSLRGLEMGIAALSPALRARTAIHPGRAGEHAARVAGADVVIADPPRKGLDAELRAALQAAPPARFVYLSCGLGAFLADARALLAAGRLRLTSLCAYDMFPFTGHVETLAVFERA
jgi:tRNA/tmRNA/rRNA uracil-C5-methylase (TrmA/RlmC/RlmD family)